MSDFDKEAEREKLREKYERDKAEREATQRMSDLLLKGATMTNKHCGTCGDPLFQQDGTTFCPSCHGNPDAVQGSELEARSAEESATDGSTARSATEPDDSDRPQPGTADDDSTTVEDASDADPEAPPERTGQTVETDPAGDPGDQPPSPPSRSTPERDVRTQSSETEPSRRSETNRAQSDEHHAESGRTPPANASPSSASPSGGLEAAHGSLVVALEKFAREAAETDDPRYAKECLEAAREAGETLDVLR
ncbi:Sjogren's syndrome/scleroderma autoantigen 1 family protein [Natronococcus wangiae]|uniref:Sjogren's syndrome/scleroderma autoantigen 1 family protein n=1 Tax=Natronococcus wangiae TaxID=3068275 RepID=UPI00273E3349|nr:Sjogren's syndrome/scleroderma autoantigen 1 family protein [Natronococcus sp. AD5]